MRQSADYMAIRCKYRREVDITFIVNIYKEEKLNDMVNMAYSPI